MTKASSSVVEVSVSSILLLKEVGVVVEGLSMIVVGVYSSEPEEITDFSDTLLPVVALLV